MTQRAKRRQNRRKQAAKQKQATEQPCLKLSFKVPDLAVERIQWLMAEMARLSALELSRLDIPRILNQFVNPVIDPEELRNSIRIEQRFQDEYDFNWHEEPYQSLRPAPGTPPSALRRIAESVAEQQEALLRASGATMQIFQIPLGEATELVQRFCSEHCTSLDNLYQRLTEGRILVHPDRYLVLEPIEQNWEIFSSARRLHRSTYIDHGSFLVPVSLLNLEISLPEHGRPQTTVDLDISSVEFQLDRGRRLWFRSIPIIGLVLEERLESAFDRTTRTVRLQIPVVSETREIAEDGSQRRTLRVSEIEYNRRSSNSAKPARPQACQGCRNYHGQTHGGNRLICAMHPYGVETEQCEDWEDGSPQVQPVTEAPF